MKYQIKVLPDPLGLYPLQESDSWPEALAIFEQALNAPGAHVEWRAGSIQIAEARRCPSCGEAYAGVPATSRADNHTAICPTCGTREALDAAGDLIDAEQRAAILRIVAGAATPLPDLDPPM